MIVLDAGAIEAFLTDETPAAEVELILLSGEQVGVAAVDLAEAADRMMRIHGATIEEFTADVIEMGCTLLDDDPTTALEGARLRATHYDPHGRAVSIARCVAAAHALRRDAVLATSDPHLLDLLVAEGGRVRVLPETRDNVTA